MDIQLCVSGQVSNASQSESKLVPILAYKSDHVPMTGERITIKGISPGEYRVKSRNLILKTHRGTPVFQYEKDVTVVDQTMVLVVTPIDKEN